jgi:hypothetical protein
VADGDSPWQTAGGDRGVGLAEGDAEAVLVAKALMSTALI